MSIQGQISSFVETRPVSIPWTKLSSHHSLLAGNRQRLKARHDNISEFGHGLQLNVLAHAVVGSGSSPTWLMPRGENRFLLGGGEGERERGKGV